MFQHWGIPPELVRVTTRRKHGCPGGGEELFPDQGSLHHPVGAHGLFALAVWGGGGILGGVGRANVQFLSYCNVHRFGS